MCIRDRLSSDTTLASRLEGIQVTPVGLYVPPSGYTFYKETGWVSTWTVDYSSASEGYFPATNRLQSTGIVLLDMNKTFKKSRTQRPALQITRTPVPPTVRWLYLTNGTLRVSTNGVSSWVRSITTGIPLGPVLSSFCTLCTQMT